MWPHQWTPRRVGQLGSTIISDGGAHYFVKHLPDPRKSHRPTGPGGWWVYVHRPHPPTFTRRQLNFSQALPLQSALCNCPHSINVLFFTFSFLNNIRIRIQRYKKTKPAWGHARNHPLPRQHVHSCSGRGLSNQFPTST